MPPRKKKVLILTHSQDQFVIERVVDALARRGAESMRFDTDLFPTTVKLATRLSNAATQSTPNSQRAHAVHTLRIGEQHLQVDDFDAVWSRKVWTPRISDEIAPELAVGCVRESTAALYGFLDGLHRARWINSLAAANAAENKLLQLRVAAEVGLRVPETLVTNDPDLVRAFHAGHRTENRAIIAKMLTPLSVSMDRTAMFVHTNTVRDEDLEHLDGLRHSPMVFQETVEKDVELRVACVGERMFAGAIDASRSERGKIDWRLARPDEVRWTRAELPADVAARLREFQRRLGLLYGAVDIIRTPRGEHVFLEVNPGGEWGMLERDLELPIADAIADELLQPNEVRT